MKARLRKFGWGWDAASANGWHVLVQDEEGEWESWSGPHFSFIAAWVSARQLGLSVDHPRAKS